MKCKIFECDNEAQGNYPCCDSKHGMMLNVIRDEIRRMQDPTMRLSVYKWADWKWFIGDYPTIKQLEYYGN